jgi:acyl carrier protein
LDKETGLLSDPELASLALSGQDIALSRLELDSLGRFGVMMAIEERLSIEIDDDEVDDIGSVDELVAFLETRVS